ncbi:hypothetical protein N9P12_02220 [Bacteroidia bacterium]|nr:hypothetical protein [Bacteroidia bacterium]
MLNRFYLIIPAINQLLSSTITITIFLILSDFLSHNEYALLSVYFAVSTIGFSIIESGLIFQINKLKIERDVLSSDIYSLLGIISLFTIPLSCFFLYHNLNITTGITFVIWYVVKETISRLSNISDGGMSGLSLNIILLTALLLGVYKSYYNLKYLIGIFLVGSVVVVIYKILSSESGAKLPVIARIKQVVFGGRYLIYANLVVAVKGQIFLFFGVFLLSELEISQLSYNKQLITPLLFFNTLLISSYGHNISDIYQANRSTYFHMLRIYIGVLLCVILSISGFIYTFDLKDILSERYLRDLSLLWLIWAGLSLFRNIKQYELVLENLEQRIFRLNLVSLSLLCLVAILGARTIPLYILPLSMIISEIYYITRVIRPAC